MKRILWMAMLALALPMTAFATSFDFSSGTFSSGTITGSLTTSLSITITGSLNTISVSTGSLSLVGSCGTGCTEYSFTGGSVAVGPGGSLFSDSLSGTSILTVTTSKSGDSLGILAQLAPSSNVAVGTGTVSLVFKTMCGGFKVTAGSIDVSGTSPVPEPSSLTLLGTGLIGLAGLIRRKLKA